MWRSVARYHAIQQCRAAQGSVLQQWGRRDRVRRAASLSVAWRGVQADVHSTAQGRARRRHTASPAPCRAWWVGEAGRASRSFSCCLHAPDPSLLLHECMQVTQPEPQPLTWRGGPTTHQAKFQCRRTWTGAGAQRRPHTLMRDM